MAYENALILAGGKGTRLRHLGELIPKCLVTIFDQPLLVRQMEQCRRAGAKRIFVSISNGYHEIVECVLERYRRSAALHGEAIPAVSCIVEMEPLGATGGLLACSSHFEGGSVLVLLGDQFYEDHRPFDLVRTRSDHEIVIGIVRTANPERILCNVVMNDDGAIAGIREKPSPASIVGNLRWSGFFGFAPGVLDRAKEYCRDSGFDQRAHVGDLLEALRANGTSVGTVEFSEVCLNLNTVEEVLYATLLEAKPHIECSYPGSGGHLDLALRELGSAIGLHLL